MYKPKDIKAWENTPVSVSTGEVEKLPPGGYVCEIKDVVVRPSSKGNEMMCLSLEVKQGEFAGIFAKNFEQKKNFDPHAKWPCTYYQLTGLDESHPDERSQSRFKGVLTAIEDSNAGYKWNWDEKSLIGKTVGVVFREEEYDYMGHTGTSTKPYYLRRADGVEEAKIPKMRTLDTSTAAPSQGVQNQTSVTADDALPF